MTTLMLSAPRLGQAAESQVASRLQESSVASNAANSNSAGSNCSQRMATAPSQQLTLIGTCANCGAQQLTQVPAQANFGQRQHQTGGLGAGCESLARQAGKQASQASCRGQRWAHSQRASCLGSSNAPQCMHKRPSLAGQPTKTNCDGGRGAPAGKQEQVGALARPLALAGQSNANKVNKCTGVNAKVLHTKIAGLAAQSQRAELLRGVSADEQLLTGSGRLVGGNGFDAAVSGGSSSNVNKNNNLEQPNMANRRPVGSLGRLNELASTTSSERPCIDESISSLANDSFVNTSQENTPCNLADHSHTHELAKGGSDSMLWNQSVYSIDYCSDCCPSYCHCSCQACSSSFNGAEEQAELGGPQGDRELALEQDDGVGQFAGQNQPDEAGCSGRRERICSLVLDSRKRFEEPKWEPTGANGQTDQSNLRPDEALELTDGRRVKSKDDTGNDLRAKRSQTMEMRTIVPAAAEQPPPSAPCKQHGARKPDERFPIQTSRQANRKGPTATPIAYALQSAATSALDACTMSGQIVPTEQYRRLRSRTSSKDITGSEMEQEEEEEEEEEYGRPERPRQLEMLPGRQQEQQSASLQGNGTIQASIDLVRSGNRRFKGAESRRPHESSCSSYHDDYEYNYGLVNSNSDSENYYYDEDSNDGDTRASSLPQEDTDDAAKDDYGDDFEHDGRLELNRQRPHAREASQSQRKGEAYRDSRSNVDLHNKALEDNRINSITLITATLSAGGAIVEAGSSGPSSRNQPATYGDEFMGVGGQSRRQAQSRSGSPKSVEEHESVLTSL